jgi:chorismate mutase
MAELKDLRGNIDSIDNAILTLLEERRELVCDIFEYKKNEGLSLQDHTREKELIERLFSKTKKFSRAEIADIWSAIITSSYKLLP